MKPDVNPKRGERMPKEEKRESQDTFESIIQAIDANEVEPDRHLSIQIDAACRDAIRAAQTSGQPASVTIAVKVRPGPERRITLAANVKANLPRPSLSAVTLYADEAGGVHRSDPDQLRMEFPKPLPFPPTNKKDS